MTPRLFPALTPPLAAALVGGLALALGVPAGGVLAAAVGAAAVAAWPRRAQPPAGLVRPASTSAGPGDEAARERAFAEALPLGVVVIARDGTIRLANSRAAAIFGLPGSGRLSAAMLRAPRLLEAIEAGLSRGEAAMVEVSLARAGDRHLAAHVRPVAGEVIVAVEDRTGSRHAAELHRDFVANASHELKTPLAAVSGIVETLLGHARDDAEATERFLRLLAAETRRMTRLVEDLLSLNRIELNERVLPREPQDLGAIVAGAVEALRPAADEAGVALSAEIPADAPLVRGDRDELGQLFRNLVENAIRYGGAGAEVRVAPVQGGGSMFGIAVSDTGPGVAREHLPRLTERFYRVSVRRSRETGGTGLGLAIVKHVVNRHRGRLEIESQPGKGSRFTVWLPLADMPPGRSGPHDPA